MSVTTDEEDRNWLSDTDTEIENENEEPIGYLTIECPPELRGTYPIVGKDVTIGSSDNADVNFSIKSVSRYHCLISKAKSGIILLEDLESTNGTAVSENGQSWTPLQPRHKYVLSGSGQKYIKLGSSVSAIFNCELLSVDSVEEGDSSIKPNIGTEAQITLPQYNVDATLVADPVVEPTLVVNYSAAPFSPNSVQQTVPNQIDQTLIVNFSALQESPACVEPQDSIDKITPPQNDNSLSLLVETPPAVKANIIHDQMDVSRRLESKGRSLSGKQLEQTLIVNCSDDIESVRQQEPTLVVQSDNGSMNPPPVKGQTTFGMSPNAKTKTSYATGTGTSTAFQSTLIASPDPTLRVISSNNVTTPGKATDSHSDQLAIPIALKPTTPQQEAIGQTVETPLTPSPDKTPSPIISTRKKKLVPKLTPPNNNNSESSPIRKPDLILTTQQPILDQSERVFKDTHEQDSIQSLKDNENLHEGQSEKNPEYVSTKLSASTGEEWIVKEPTQVNSTAVGNKSVTPTPKEQPSNNQTIPVTPKDDQNPSDWKTSDRMTGAVNVKSSGLGILPNETRTVREDVQKWLADTKQNKSVEECNPPIVTPAPAPPPLEPVTEREVEKFPIPLTSTRPNRLKEKELERQKNDEIMTDDGSNGKNRSSSSSSSSLVLPKKIKKSTKPSKKRSIKRELSSSSSSSSDANPPSAKRKSSKKGAKKPTTKKAKRQVNSSDSDQVKQSNQKRLKKESTSMTFSEDSSQSEPPVKARKIKLKKSETLTTTITTTTTTTASTTTSSDPDTSSTESSSSSDSSVKKQVKKSSKKGAKKPTRKPARRIRSPSTSSSSSSSSEVVKKKPKKSSRKPTTKKSKPIKKRDVLSSSDSEPVKKTKPGPKASKKIAKKPSKKPSESKTVPKKGGTPLTDVTEMPKPATHGRSLLPFMNIELTKESDESIRGDKTIENRSTSDRTTTDNESKRLKEDGEETPQPTNRTLLSEVARSEAVPEALSNQPKVALLSDSERRLISESFTAEATVPQNSNSSSDLINIMTTGVVLEPHQIEAIERLGASVVTDPSACTHLITNNPMRTPKLLCAISVAKYILHLDWIRDSEALGAWQPVSKYQFSNTNLEERYSFSIQESLSLASKKPIFQGLSFFITDVPQRPGIGLADMVLCGGGSLVSSVDNASEV